MHEVLFFEKLQIKKIYSCCLNMKKGYDFSLEFILYEVLVRTTADKTHLLVMSENDIELLINVLPYNLQCLRSLIC